jgi:hypothetical protein
VRRIAFPYERFVAVLSIFRQISEQSERDNWTVSYPS